MSLLSVFLFLGCVNPYTPIQGMEETAQEDTGGEDLDMSPPPPSEPDLRLPHLCYPHPADPANESRCRCMMKDMLAGKYGEELQQEAIRVIQSG